MTQQTKQCPYCEGLVSFTAKKCKFCGEWLEEKTMPTPTSVQDPDTLIRQALAEKYELQEAVGRGGMATVYRAIQKNLDRTVALKVIHQNLVHDTEFVSRFLREARLIASLSHPHIVTIYDVGSVGSVHYLAMEFLQGEDLHSMVGNQGALPPEKVVNWMIALADALDYLHKKRYVHRDIKSSNIIITHEGRPVLMDFGIAHAADGTKLTQAGTVIGTPEYMSPEQAQGKTVDGHSDLYSLGVVMYECLTGKVPFKGDNPLTTIHRVIYDRPEPLVTQNSRLPGWLQEVTLSLLEKEPGNRPDNGRELAAALQSKRRVSVPKKEQLTQKITLPEKSARPGLDTKKKTALWVLPWIIGVVAVMFVAVAVMLFFDGNPSAQRQEAVVINPAPADTLRGPVTQTTQVKPQAATNNRERAEEFEQAGDYLAAQKSYPKAIASYDSALVLMPGNPVLSAKRQQAQAKLKELQEAEAAARREEQQRQAEEKRFEQQRNADEQKLAELDRIEKEKLENEKILSEQNSQKNDTQIERLKQEEKKEQSVDEQVYFIVEEMPKFPGGEAALRSFIANSMKYPQIAQENGIQGRVYVQFVIERDGSVSNASIARGVDPSLDREALRVVKSLPKWEPGLQRGKPVKVSYTVPINFILQ
jgi:TonB family protein